MAFTDDDCRPEPGWLEALVAAARRAPGSVVQGLTRPDPLEAAVLAAPHVRTLSIEPVGPFAQTCNIVYPRAARAARRLRRARDHRRGRRPVAAGPRRRDADRAGATLLWKRLTGRPVVFTCAQRLDRARVADRRLRLQLLTAAVQDTDALVAADALVRGDLRRWLAVDGQTIAPGDGVAHALLYQRLLG